MSSKTFGGVVVYKYATWRPTVRDHCERDARGVQAFLRPARDDAWVHARVLAQRGLIVTAACSMQCCLRSGQALS